MNSGRHGSRFKVLTTHNPVEIGREAKPLSKPYKLNAHSIYMAEKHISKVTSKPTLLKVEISHKLILTF